MTKSVQVYGRKTLGKISTLFTLCGQATFVNIAVFRDQGMAQSVKSLHASMRTYIHSSEPRPPQKPSVVGCACDLSSRELETDFWRFSGPGV